MIAIARRRLNTYLQRLDNAIDDLQQLINRDASATGVSRAKVMSQHCDAMRRASLTKLDELTDVEVDADRLDQLTVVFERMDAQAKETIARADTWVNSFHQRKEEEKQASRDALKRYGKLADLEIASFDGSPDRYPEFEVSFNSTIDRRADLDDAAKINYLINCCKGKAAEFLKRYKGTNDYALVRNELRKRFGGLNKIIEHVSSQLHTLKSKGTSPAAQRSYLDQVQALCHTLRSNAFDLNNRETTSWAAAVCAQLDRDVVVGFTRNRMLAGRTNDDIITLGEIVKYAEADLLSKDATQAYRGSSNENQSKGGGKSKGQSHGTSLTASSPRQQQQSKKKKQQQGKKQGGAGRSPFKQGGGGGGPSTANGKDAGFTCAFCGNKHKSLACEKAKKLSTKDRVDALFKRKNGCSRCLAADHRKNKCQRDVRQCGIDGCQGDHHRFLHGGFTKQK